MNKSPDLIFPLNYTTPQSNKSDVHFNSSHYDFNFKTLGWYSLWSGEQFRLEGNFGVSLHSYTAPCSRPLRFNPHSEEALGRAAGSISNWLEQIAAPVSGLISTALNTVIRGIKRRCSGRAAGRKRSCEWLQRLSIFISPETLDWTRTEPHPAPSSGNSHWGRPGQSWALEQKNNL